jgi:UDP-2-acetamido-3-amino-2,3-dideoxy-glucuronate N-acetyltransferase
MNIHKTADVSKDAMIGNNTKVENWAQIQARAVIGDNCLVSKGVYIDFEVKIGNNVKLQNNVSVYHGVTIEDGVFVGPHVCFTNDKNPRAVYPDGSYKDGSECKVSPITVKEGASIGANATILPGVTIGKFAMIGSGAVVTKDIPDYALAYGNPARVVRKVNENGDVLI